MKKMYVMLALLLCAAMLAGCAGTPVVYYSDCTCPTGAHEEVPAQTDPAQETVPSEGGWKTGLALVTGVSGSTSAADGENGAAKYDVTIVAVTLDEKGVIRQCIIDGISTSVAFDGSGAIVSQLGAVPTKVELGDNYGMLAAGAIAEWDDQAAALAAFAVGKTVEELSAGAIDETGKAPAGSDLASSATIYLGGYVSAIEAAAANAQYLGAQESDVLKLAVTAENGSSVGATAEEAGTAQLDVNVAAITMNGDVITSCVIDAVQAKVTFDASGVITSDVTTPVQTKNQLGAAYGMVAYGQATAEWNEQAAAFAAYVTGKTPAEVAGISVNERTAPVDADLASSVTIAVGGFQVLIAKAAQ